MKKNKSPNRQYLLFVWLFQITHCESKADQVKSLWAVIFDSLRATFFPPPVRAALLVFFSRAKTCPEFWTCHSHLFRISVVIRWLDTSCKCYSILLHGTGPEFLLGLHSPQGHAWQRASKECSHSNSDKSKRKQAASPLKEQFRVWAQTWPVWMQVCCVFEHNYSSWGRAVKHRCVYGIIAPLPGLLMCINAHLASLSFAWTLISVRSSWLFFCWQEQQMLSVNTVGRRLGFSWA